MLLLGTLIRIRKNPGVSERLPLKIGARALSRSSPIRRRVYILYKRRRERLLGWLYTREYAYGESRAQAIAESLIYIGDAKGLPYNAAALRRVLPFTRRREAAV